MLTKSWRCSKCDKLFNHQEQYTTDMKIVVKRKLNISFLVVELEICPIKPYSLKWMI